MGLPVPTPLCRGLRAAVLRGGGCSSSSCLSRPELLKPSQEILAVQENHAVLGKIVKNTYATRALLAILNNFSPLPPSVLLLLFL